MFTYENVSIEMENVKSKRRSLRRQWSVDVPSSIQRKLRQVAFTCRRSKSLDEANYKERLLKPQEEHEEKQKTRNSATFENLGRDRHSVPTNSPLSSSSSPWYSFDDDMSDCSLIEVDETQNETGLNDIQIVDMGNCESIGPEKASIPMKIKEFLGSSTYSGLLSTIDEFDPKTKRSSTFPVFNNEKMKREPQSKIPRDFADFDHFDYYEKDNEPEIGERYRRYAICEEMERYISVDHKGQSLRKYRETLIRHRVLKELCLL